MQKHRSSGIKEFLKNNMDFKAIIIPLLACLLTINSNERIARESRISSRPDLSLRLGNFTIPNQDTISIVYGLNYCKPSLNITYLPFTIFNSGKITCEDIIVSFISPYLSLSLADSLLPIEKNPLIGGKRTYHKLRKEDCFVYEFPSLHPGLNIDIREPLFLRYISSYPHPSNYISQDPPGTIPIIPCKVSVSAKNCQSYEIICLISIISAGDLDDLINKTINHHLTGHKDTFLVFPDILNIQGDSITVYDLEIREASDWKLLRKINLKNHLQFNIINNDGIRMNHLIYNKDYQPYNKPF